VGETPLEGIFIKQRCQKLAEGHQVTIESRHYYKARAGPARSQQRRVDGEPVRELGAN
jgi:hypothetical protein